MLLLLAESVCARMRELASRCTVVEVYVRDTELCSFIRQRKLTTPSCSSTELADIAFALFLANYRWEKPVRSIGVRGSGLVEAYECVQLSLYLDDQRREKWERIDTVMDEVRNRYGYMSLQRAVIYTDPLLAEINPKDDHTVHPVGYFAG
jgi:DNA polymerase-4